MAYELKHLTDGTLKLLGNDILVATKVIRVYCAYQKRNEWTTWHGDTDIVNRPTGVISFSLEAATARVEQSRTPGTKFSIEDRVALAFVGKRAALLVVDFFSKNPFLGVKEVNPPKGDIWQLHQLRGVIPSVRFRNEYVLTGSLDVLHDCQDFENFFDRSSTAGGKRNGLAWTLKPVTLNISGLMNIARQLEPPTKTDAVARLVTHESQDVKEQTSHPEPQHQEAEPIETLFSIDPVGIPIPKTTVSEVSQYQRDSSVKNWVLQQANGKCECCGGPAPFVGMDGVPFLEVHHVVQMAHGGSDTLSNVVALCPNCHRALHYGAKAVELAEHLYKTINRLIRE